MGVKEFERRISDRFRIDTKTLAEGAFAQPGFGFERSQRGETQDSMDAALQSW